VVLRFTVSFVLVVEAMASIFSNRVIAHAILLTDIEERGTVKLTNSASEKWNRRQFIHAKMNPSG